MSFPRDSLAGQVVDDRWQVLRQIGEGGMGAVYEAQDRQLSRRVAVKVVHPELARDRAYVGRLRLEAQHAARINDGRVVAVFYVGETADGVVYLVMEYVEGRTLRSVLQQDGRLGVRRALRLGWQIGDALRSVHAAGVIHRDVKPENVMVRSGRDGEDIKLMDFGIAKPAGGDDGTLTRSGLLVGTPEYMAPEQIEGGLLTAQTDLYAWGTVVYEMLAGAPPFQAPTPAAVLVRQIHEAARPLRRMRGDLPREVERLVAAVLAKRPSERPTGFDDALDVIARALDAMGPGGAEFTGPHAAARDADAARTAIAPRHPSPAPSSWWMFFSLLGLGLVAVGGVVWLTHGV